MNGSSFRKHNNASVDEEVYYTDGNDLYLGPDFLKDDFTLLDCSLGDSPHFGFMKCLNQGGIPGETEYVYRYCSGTLDGRIGYKRISDFSVYFEKFNDRKVKVLSNCMEPVIVYEWKGRKYIYDGKHRAALCLFLGRSIPYVLFNKDCIFSGITECQLNMAKKRPALFSKHIHFFE